MNILKNIKYNKYAVKSDGTALSLKEKMRGPLVLNSRSLVEIKNSTIITNGNSTIRLGEKSYRIKPSKQTILSMHDNARLIIDGHCIISEGTNITINKNAVLDVKSSFINCDVKIHCFNKIVIGKGTAISENVYIRDSDNHQINENSPISAPIIIGEKVLIGLNATLLKGVTIGDGAVIAAGAVVTRDIPAHCLAAGVPARVIKENIPLWK